MDNYAIKTLEAIERGEEPLSLVVAMIFPFSARHVSRNDLTRTFNQVAGVMESRIHDLVSLCIDE